MKRFVYLVQSEKGLGKNLNKLYGPDSDILLLTWRKPVANGIFFPLSTWTQGINKLYREVSKSNYLYFIFVDDDIELQVTEQYKGISQNPWRIFEKNLLEFLPAIGTPRLKGHKSTSFNTESVFWFDAISMAIHREAIKVLFPLYDGNDAESWWISGIYLRYTSALLYPNHILQFNTIEATNKKHRPYSKKIDWQKIDSRFKTAILDRRLAGIFRPIHTIDLSINGRVEKKSMSYEYTQKELSLLFDFDNRIFRRGENLDHHIFRVPYWGEFFRQILGNNVSTYIFSPLIALYELKKKALSLFGKLKSMLCKHLDTFLKVTRPLRHRLGLKRRINETVTTTMIDKFIGQHSRNYKSFFVIQIGSNDGHTRDPIYKYVVKNKWKGIFIEPVPYIFKKLKKTYKDFKGLTFENVAIGEKSGYKTFYRIKRNNNPNNPIWYDQLGSFKKEVVEKHRYEIPNFYKYLISEKIRCISLNKLLSKHKIFKINLLHIDTEGYDYEIIKHIPFGITKPKMILYEYLHLTKSDRNLCEKLLRENGYKLMSTNGDTLAYLSNTSDYKNL